MATWRSSVLREALTKSKWFNQFTCLSIIECCREINDDAFVHDTLSSLAKKVTCHDVENFIEKMSKLKDEMPDSELQRYCDIVLNASAEARKEFRLFELKPINRLLTDHLPDFPLAAGAIREYVLAILRVPVKVGGRYDEPDEKVVDCFVAVVEVLGEEALPLLPPPPSSIPLSTNSSPSLARETAQHTPIRHLNPYYLSANPTTATAPSRKRN
jgi:hypothetical protein